LVLTNISCSDNTSENTSEYGELSGIVKGTEVDVLPVIYAYNTDKDVGYTVFVVDGEYKANHMIAGNYDVTLRPAVGQLKSFSSQTHSFYIDKGLIMLVEWIILMHKFSPTMKYTLQALEETS
jgi:hypothetical protein